MIVKTKSFRFLRSRSPGNSDLKYFDLPGRVLWILNDLFYIFTVKSLRIRVHLGSVPKTSAADPRHFVVNPHTTYHFDAAFLGIHGTIFNVHGLQGLYFFERPWPSESSF
jgi:hypothetical protein